MRRRGEARLRWESSFAAGGVGCVISSFTPISIRGRIMVNYATIDHDDKIEFWSRVAKHVHEAGKTADQSSVDDQTSMPDS